MARVKLKRFAGKKGDTASNIIEMLRALDPTLHVVDAEGNALVGAPHPSHIQKYPIEFEGEILGWVMGGKQAAALAALLAQLAAKEAEKKSLANEVLGLYREINLLYNLSERLAVSLELGPVAQKVLAEANALIKATGGSVMLLNETHRALETVAAFGSAAQQPSPLACADLIIDVVAQSGRAEIVNDASADPRYIERENPISSLVCAPLKAKQAVTGVIVLCSMTPVLYTAADLKLLNTLASQAGPAIESAVLYEKTLREAKEREERLQRQIEQLKIELDEARMTKQVTEITESDYFQRLREQAEGLRRTMDGLNP